MGTLNWTLTFDGQEFRPPLTTGQVITIAEFAGVEGWEVMDPLRSPVILSAYYTILVAERAEVPPEVVAAEIMRRPLDELISGVKMGD